MVNWVASSGAEPQAFARLAAATTAATAQQTVQPRWAYLFFPHWPIQRLVVEQPELRRQQVVLFADQPPRGRRVTAASPLALRAGIQPGMPVAEARALIKKTSTPPTAVAAPAIRQYWLPAHPAADQKQLEQLADDLHGFSPVVGLDRVAARKGVANDTADGLWLEVTGLAHLFGDEANWLRQLLTAIEAHGYWAQAAIADTPGQAWAWAHYPPPANPSPTNNTDLAADNTEATIPTADTLLHQLPPAALRLSSETCATLQRLGIVTVAQLQRLPRASLAARFGNEIYEHWDQFVGDKIEVIPVRSPPTDYQARQLLDFPLTDMKTVEVIIGRLIAQLCQQLHSRRLGAWHWRVQLDRQSTQPFVLSIDLYEPSSTDSLIMDLVRLHLDRYCQREILAGAITEIQVTAQRWTALGERQRLLFDEDPQPNQQALAGLVNRLVIRLGPQQVLRPLSVSGVQPELARRYRSWVGGATRANRNEPREVYQGLLARPARLLSQPVPLQVVTPATPQPSVAPASQATALLAGEIVYPPPALAAAGLRYDVSRWWGPERIETGWWRGQTVRRDYWRIETPQQCQYWIYYDLQRRQWFLQGWF